MESMNIKIECVGTKVARNAVPGPSSSSSRWSIWNCNDNGRVLQPRNVIKVIQAKIHEFYLVTKSKVASKKTFSCCIKILHINILTMMGFDLHYTIMFSRKYNVKF